MKNSKSTNDMTNREKMEYIHLLLVNGQKQEMVKEIEEWGKTFFEDYRYYLDGLYIMPSSVHGYFSRSVFLYHKLKK